MKLKKVLGGNRLLLKDLLPQKKKIRASLGDDVIPTIDQLEMNYKTLMNTINCLFEEMVLNDVDTVNIESTIDRLSDVEKQVLMRQYYIACHQNNIIFQISTNFSTQIVIIFFYFVNFI